MTTDGFFFNTAARNDFRAAVLHSAAARNAIPAISFGFPVNLSCLDKAMSNLYKVGSCLINANLNSDQRGVFPLFMRTLREEFEGDGSNEAAVLRLEECFNGVPKIVAIEEALASLPRMLPKRGGTIYACLKELVEKVPSRQIT